MPLGEDLDGLSPEQRGALEVRQLEALRHAWGRDYELWREDGEWCARRRWQRVARPAQAGVLRETSASGLQDAVLREWSADPRPPGAPSRM